MDVRTLRYALTLADELHFGRAARRHYIAAQPFGRHIRDLEQELGTKLFERTSRRVYLTPAGERFLPRARRALAQIDALMPEHDNKPTDSTLRIGILGFGLADRWAATRALLARHHADLMLHYVELDWENQYDAVRTGEVDVAIVHDVGGADDLRLEPVMDAAPVAIVPVESDLAEADQLTERDLCDRPRVRLVGQPGLAAWDGGRSPTGGIQVRSPANLPGAVATTGQIGLHGEPASRYFPHPRVRYVPITGPPGVVAIASRPRDQSDAVLAFHSAVAASAAVEQLGALLK